MQIIAVPSQLPERIELLRWNALLRQHKAQLDWQHVPASAQLDPAALATLLDGLTLSDHYDQLGVDTIPEALMPTISATLERILARIESEEDEDDEQTAEMPAIVLPKKPAAQPALWLPDEEAPEEVSAEENTAHEHEHEVPATAIPEQAKTPTLTDPQPIQTELEAAETPTAILQAPSASVLRQELEEMVIRELQGPAAGPEEEVIESRVRDRYLVGMLAPKNSQMPAEEQDSTGTSQEGTEDRGQTDSDSSQVASLSPSSMGMSFCVDLQETQLKITTRWGHYQRTTSEEPANSGDRVWRRVPRGGEPHILTLQEGDILPWRPEAEEQPDIYVRGLVRRTTECWTVTLFLVNDQNMPKVSRDTNWIFQPELIVEAPHGGPIFQHRPGSLQQLYKSEDKALAMLYRKHASFAVGHGVSVHAETLENDPTSAVRLSTSFIPRYEVPRTEAPTREELPALAELCLDMETLFQTANMQDFAPKLFPLVTAYEDWIAEQERKLDDPAEKLSHFHDTASEALAKCRTTLKRLQAGIELVSRNPQAAQAFRFMNRAMSLQRIHTMFAEEQRRQGQRSLTDFDIPANRSWRPFQLAFILLNIPSLTDLHHPDRSDDVSATADLLWFPTGGGKTEAYLGLTAYTLGIRRLQGTVAGRSGEDGIAVIMRYTLRLLTLQQFQRAAALICACEIIRRTESETWGTTPFRLGLWVGQHSTPNKTNESFDAVSELRTRGSYFSGAHGNPRQLTHCPWCGGSIDAGKNIIVEKYQNGRARTFTYCSDGFGRCPFSNKNSQGEGLPVLVVDEEIYRLLPSLLIATVDKFAQLPWRGETQMLFGQVNKYCERHGFRSPEIEDSDSHNASAAQPKARSHTHAPLRPPDLIIQDELHLISGPLGTMVGLYETAVDALSTWEVDGQPVRPKVIAATATIRQAEHQVKALFRRTVNIFPPQGIDIKDNFFSLQREPSLEKPGRLYLGICANGRRMKAAEIRVYLAYLAAAQTLYDKYGPAASDPWMTLVGYFNSMSELGGMRHLVDDDISTRLYKMDKRGLARRSIRNVNELTSRVSSSDIPKTLSDLEQTFTTKKRGIDVLLATNMISVGVDVSRLSLMVVAGQPKTTAEYIQATSRVGRAFPGLVCTIYNWARPRDLSHYEQFEHYHATFYQQVEALSVTPFAPRALDRGLAAILTSIIRLSGETYNKNNSAGSVSTASPELAQAIAIIKQRARDIAELETEPIVEAQLERLKAHWLHRADTHASLGYDKERNSKTLPLLSEPGQGQWELFTCQNSLRNVEPGVRLLLDDDSGLGSPDTATSDED